MRKHVASLAYALLFLGVLAGLLLPWSHRPAVLVRGCDGRSSGPALLALAALGLLGCLLAFFLPSIRKRLDLLSLPLGGALFAGALYRLSCLLTVTRSLMEQDIRRRGGTPEALADVEAVYAYGAGIPIALFALNLVVLLALGRILYRYLHKPR